MHSFTSQEVTEIIDATPEEQGDAVTWTHPFNTHRKHRRTQTVYLASDMRTDGVSCGFIITELQLKFSKKPALPLQNLRVEYAFTSETRPPPLGWFKTILCHGPSTLMPANVQIGANNWTELVLSKPIDWDGVSNLVLQFSFDNNDSKEGGLQFKGGLVYCVQTPEVRSKFHKSARKNSSSEEGEEKKVPYLRMMIQVCVEYSSARHVSTRHHYSLKNDNECV